MDDPVVPGAPTNRYFSQPGPKGKLFYIFWSPFRSLLAPFWIPLTRLWLPLAAFWLPFGALWFTFAPPGAPFSHFCGLLTSFLIFKQKTTKFQWNQIAGQPNRIIPKSAERDPTGSLNNCLHPIHQGIKGPERNICRRINKAHDNEYVYAYYV